MRPTQLLPNQFAAPRAPHVALSLAPHAPRCPQVVTTCRQHYCRPLVKRQSTVRRRSRGASIKPEVFPVWYTGVMSCARVEATLLIHLLFGGFQKVQVVDNHRLLV